jgi:hypothetical protein
MEQMPREHLRVPLKTTTHLVFHLRLINRFGLRLPQVWDWPVLLLLEMKMVDVKLVVLAVQTGTRCIT